MAELSQRVTHALTQTLLPKYYKYVAKDQYEKTFSKVVILLRKTTNYYTLVAELTKKMNIHYHATVVFKDNDHRDIYIDESRLIGMIDCNRVQDDKSWDDYIMKHLIKTQKYLQLEYPPIAIWDINAITIIKETATRRARVAKNKRIVAENIQAIDEINEIQIK